MGKLERFADLSHPTVEISSAIHTRKSPPRRWLSSLLSSVCLSQTYLKRFLMREPIELMTSRR